MAVTPAGVLSLPLARLRTLISESAAFQTWVSAEDAAAALANIHFIAAEVSDARPIAIIANGTAADFNAVAGGAGQEFDEAGSLWLMLEGDVSSSNDNAADAFFEFTNPVGAIIADLLASAGADDNLVIRSISLLGGPDRSDPKQGEAEDYYQAIFEVAWGV